MSKREKPGRVAGQVVYVGMRVYDPVTRKMRNCRGMTIRFEKFTPEEVHELIVAAALKAVPTARVIGERSARYGEVATHRADAGPADGGPAAGHRDIRTADGAEGQRQDGGS